MAQPNVPDDKVERLARRYREVPQGGIYAAFCGIVTAALDGAGLTDAERLTEISNARTALDMVLAEGRAVFTVPAAAPLRDETPAEGEPAPPALTAAGLTPEADASRGPLAGTVPVVAYFTQQRGYVTVVAPTYDACRDTMFAHYGNRWGLSYLAGTSRATDRMRGLSELRVVVAPGVISYDADPALEAAAALLAVEPVSEAR